MLEYASRGEGGLPGPGGVCLVPGGLPGPRGGLPGPGGSAWSRGGLPGPGGGSAWSRGGVCLVLGYLHKTNNSIEQD